VAKKHAMMRLVGAPPNSINNPGATVEREVR
jgi:hypothetical protein